MIRWNNSYIYYILVVLTFIGFMISDDTVEVPTWGTAAGVLFLIYGIGDQAWNAFKKQGRAAILVSLKPTEGGHSTIHPDDISIAMNKGEGLPSFVVFATGGFVYGGIEWKGSENFVVCPPEHIESTGPAFICHTKLRRVPLESLPDYIQNELRKLPLFKASVAKYKKNIWFGMTSKREGTSNIKWLERESKFLDQGYVINQYKTLLNDMPVRTKEKKQQFIIDVPE